MNKRKRTNYAKFLLGCFLVSYFQMFASILPAFGQSNSVGVTISIDDDGKLSYVSDFTIPENSENFESKVIWAKNCDLENVDRTTLLQELDLVELPAGSLIKNNCDSIIELNEDSVYKVDGFGEYYAFVKENYTNDEDDVVKNYDYGFDTYQESVVALPDDSPEIEVTLSYDGNGSLVSNFQIENYDEQYEETYSWYKDCEVVDEVVDFENCELLSETSDKLTPEYNLDSSVYYSVVTVDLLNGESLSDYDSKEVVFPKINDDNFSTLEYRAGERFSFTYNDENSQIVNVVATLDGFLLNAVLENNVWSLTGEQLLYVKEMDLEFTAYNNYGFSDSVIKEVKVLPGIVDLANSTLSVTSENGLKADYVEVDSGELEILFTANDKYNNKISVSDLDRVDVRYNGNLLEGADKKSLNSYQVERTLLVPSKEDLNGEITVDVFSSECEGVLLGEENYCFSKVHKLVVYDTQVEQLENLVYVKRTNESTVRISGEKLSGYGVKLNLESSEYIVEPNDSTVFSFELSLAEGLNKVSLYAVKHISSELEFYSEPIDVTVEKDTTVSSIKWNNPSIVLTGENQATLYWTDPIHFSEYDQDFSYVNIYRSTVPNFVPSESNLIAKTQNPSWTDSGLVAGANYYYAIESVDDLGNVSELSPIVATGQILGEAAVSYPVYEVSEVAYVGKGADQIVEDSSSDLIVNNDLVTDTEENVNIDDSQGTSGEDSEEVKESFGNKLGQFFSNVTESTKTLFGNITKNIFVQICIGGVLIFVGLMILISVLVWIKEKIVDARLISLDEDESSEED